MNEAELEALMARSDLTLAEKATIIGESDVSGWLAAGEVVHYDGPRKEIPMEVRSVRMSIETYDKLAALAEAQGVKPTALIRLAVEQFVARAETEPTDLAEARQALVVLGRLLGEAEDRLSEERARQADHRKAA